MEKLNADLATIKKRGSTGSGVHEWWYQRLSAIILILASCWLFCFSRSLVTTDLIKLIEVINRPYNTIMLFLFVVAGFYHAYLGMKVVIEDYIHCSKIKLLLIILVQIFCIVTVLGMIVAVSQLPNLY